MCLYTLNVPMFVQYKQSTMHQKQRPCDSIDCKHCVNNLTTQHDHHPPWFLQLATSTTAVPFNLTHIYAFDIPSNDPSGILNLRKPFIQGFLSLINFLKARIKHLSIIFNIFTAILLLVIILKPSMVKGTSLRTL